MYVVNEEEEQILQMENTLDYVCSQLSDYKEKHIARGKRHEEEKCKSRKYCTLLWLMLILYVTRVMLPTV
jgi:hypothetical protein